MNREYVDDRNDFSRHPRRQQFHHSPHRAQYQAQQSCPPRFQSTSPQRAQSRHSKRYEDNRNLNGTIVRSPHALRPDVNMHTSNGPDNFHSFNHQNRYRAEGPPSNLPQYFDQSRSPSQRQHRRSPNGHSRGYSEGLSTGYSNGGYNMDSNGISDRSYDHNTIEPVVTGPRRRAVSNHLLKRPKRARRTLSKSRSPRRPRPDNWNSTHSVSVHSGSRSPNLRSPNQRSPNQRSPNQRSPNQRSPNQRSPNQRFTNRRSPNRRSRNLRSPNQRSPNRTSPNRQSRNQKRGNKVPQQHWKDEEFEQVVEAMQMFFDQRSMNKQSSDAAMKEIRFFVMHHCRTVSEYKFQFSWDRATTHRLVIEVQGTGRYKMIDVEDNGIPQRMNEFENIEDELEHLVESVMNSDDDGQVEQKTKDLKCYFCERLFFDVNGLKQHCQQSHAKAQGYLYQCDQCPHKFRRSQQLVTHINTQHVRTDNQPRDELMPW